VTLLSLEAWALAWEGDLDGMGYDAARPSNDHYHVLSIPPAVMNFVPLPGAPVGEESPAREG